ncbi:MAG: cytochrome c [Deltaproteobacteria bacterium]|nr:cytochrome c [Deltaproteobacteria bacterium]
MTAHRLLLVAFLACLALVASGCGGEDDSIPNQSADAQAIRKKVEAQMEEARLKRLAPRMAGAVASAAASPSASVAPAAPDASSGEKPSARPAADLYAANCSSCHGPKGAGDGPLSAGLVPPPAKHSDGAYMNALSNEHLFKVVKEGGTAVGKSATMAPWGTSMSDEEITGLVVFLRGLADPPYTGPMP